MCSSRPLEGTICTSVCLPKKLLNFLANSAIVLMVEKFFSFVKCDQVKCNQWVISEVETFFSVFILSYPLLIVK